MTSVNVVALILPGKMGISIKFLEKRLIVSDVIGVDWLTSMTSGAAVR